MPILRRAGRPGLLGTIARTAVVAGTATAVSGAVAQNQQTRAAERQAYAAQQTAATAPVPAASVPVAAPPVDVVARLQQLGDLHVQGLLSADEFARAKQQLLGG